jgi:hypothetical protein
MHVHLRFKRETAGHHPNRPERGRHAASANAILNDRVRSATHATGKVFSRIERNNAGRFKHSSFWRRALPFG